MSRRFNGTSDTATTGLALSAFTNGTGGCVAAWVLPLGSIDDAGNVFDLGAIVADSGGFFGLHIGRQVPDSVDSINAYLWDGGVKQVKYTLPAYHRWYHAAMRWDSSNLYLYINGELYSSTAAGAITDVTGTLRFGEGFSGTRRFYRGDMAEIAMWGEGLAISDAWIRRMGQGDKPSAVRGNGPAVTGYNPTGYWPFEGIYDPEPEYWEQRSVTGDGTPTTHPPQVTQRTARFARSSPPPPAQHRMFLVF